jgi:hypothetical protein
MSAPSTSTHNITFTKKRPDGFRLSRRELLATGLGLGGSFLVGGGFLAASTAAWAMEVKALEPAAMATLVQMARDVYPHDRFGDELYALAVKGHDDKAANDAMYKTMIEEGVAGLDTQAKALGHSNYVSAGWESERVEILRSIQDSAFFNTIRGGLVVGLYNQKAVWDLLGYEGPSFEKGGYLDRGFDDVNWL